METDDLSEMIKFVADTITDQIIIIAEGQLISPWTSYATGAFTAYISSNIQN